MGPTTLCLENALMPWHGFSKATHHHRAIFHAQRALKQTRPAAAQPLDFEPEPCKIQAMNSSRESPHEAFVEREDPWLRYQNFRYPKIAIATQVSLLKYFLNYILFLSSFIPSLFFFPFSSCFLSLLLLILSLFLVSFFILHSSSATGY